MHRIEGVKAFAFGGTGLSGRTSAGEADFKVVLSLKPQKATGALEKLYAEGNPQAKGFALAGLRKRNPSRFEELRMSLRDSDVNVKVQSGCIISSQLLRKIADDLHDGRYDYWIQ